jgi:hypothetical protein
LVLAVLVVLQIAEHQVPIQYFQQSRQTVVVLVALLIYQAEHHLLVVQAAAQVVVVVQMLLVEVVHLDKVTKAEIARVAVLHHLAVVVLARREQTM